MSNYPAGSMRGSGIYQQERDMRRECESDECEGTRQDGILVIDDWGNGAWICSVCEHEEELNMDEEFGPPEHPDL